MYTRYSLIIITISISLMFLSCGVGHQSVQLPNNQYKIEVKRSIFLPDDNIFGAPITTHEELLRKKASEICSNYRILSKDSTTTIWQGQTTKSWTIECLRE